MAASPGGVVVGIPGGAQIPLEVGVQGAWEVSCGIDGSGLAGIQEPDGGESGAEVGGGDQWHAHSMKRPVQAVP